MRSYVSNAKEFCYITPVVLNEIGKVNIVCEGFVITETHLADTYQHQGTIIMYMQYHLMNL